jgi:hypothetical protein
VLAAGSKVNLVVSRGARRLRASIESELALATWGGAVAIRYA